MNEYPASQPDPMPVPEPRQIPIRMPATQPIATYILIGLTVFVYVLQMLSTAVLGDSIYGIDYVTLFGARITEAIYAGQVWRLITPIFLHGSLTHIFFNMYALFSIGSLLERHFGHWRFLALYFLGGFSGYVLSLLFTQGYSVGASTAVFGLVSAEIAFFYHNRDLFGSHARQAIGNAVFIIAINLFLGLSPNIDNWGHIGGLAGGAVFSWFASPKWMAIVMPSEAILQDQREFREIMTGALLVLLLFGGLTVWGFISYYS